jgi:hypothetical protein
VLFGALIGATRSWPLVFSILAALSVVQALCVLPLRRGVTVS